MKRDCLTAPVLSVLAAVVLVPAAASFGTSWRNDVGEAPYLAIAQQAKYDCVVRLSSGYGSSYGSGVLIHPHYILTAAHVADAGALDVEYEQADGTIRTIEADWSKTHIKWDGDINSTGAYDIGLVYVNEPITDLNTASLYTGSSELGRVATMVGYGIGGTGEEGVYDEDGNAIYSSAKRGHQNVIDVLRRGSGNIFGSDDYIKNLTFEVDFDDPTGTMPNVYGSDTPLAFEGLITPGDSGGGVFAEINGGEYLIGINSYGVALDPGEDNIMFDYGDIGGFVRVSQFTEWIAEAMAEIDEDFDRWYPNRGEDGFTDWFSGHPWNVGVPISSGSVVLSGSATANDMIADDFAPGYPLPLPMLNPANQTGTAVDGDWNGDGTLDPLDIEAFVAMYGEEVLAWGGADYNYDKQINVLDLEFLIQTIFETYMGDVNLDGSVDEADLAIFADGWKVGDGYDWLSGDITGDGVINEADLAYLADTWGASAPQQAPAATPEPATIALLGIGGLLAIRRR